MINDTKYTFYSFFAFSILISFVLFPTVLQLYVWKLLHCTHNYNNITEFSDLKFQYIKQKLISNAIADATKIFSLKYMGILSPIT